MHNNPCDALVNVHDMVDVCCVVDFVPNFKLSTLYLS